MGRAMAKKVILIEDDGNMLCLLQTLLELEGFQVIHYDDGTLEGILTAMHAEKPSLALIDINLPHINGLNLLKRIRQDAGLNGMRVLMSSGMDYSSECLCEGADDFILKPFMPDDLIRAIQQTLRAEHFPG